MWESHCQGCLFVLKWPTQFKSPVGANIGKTTLKWKHEIAKISNVFSTSLCVTESGTEIFQIFFFFFSGVNLGVLRGPFLTTLLLECKDQSFHLIIKGDHSENFHALCDFIWVRARFGEVPNSLTDIECFFLLSKVFPKWDLKPMATDKSSVWISFCWL